MDSINNFDKIVANKVFKKCVDKGYDKYSQIAVLLNKSESFVKAIFSTNRKKLNLYHLMILSYELNCNISDFIPTLKDYKSIFPNIESEMEAFYMSIKGE